MSELKPCPFCGSNKVKLVKKKTKYKGHNAYVASVLQEISDHRTNIKRFVKDTEELTGVNITKLIDKTCEVIEQ